MADSKNTNYNPDVLSCLANLSNDEVFTPPEIVNAMLDLLPQDLFKNPDIKFLDPACKSGVFLREIAKRLIKGLEKIIPNLQDRLDHIFHKQLYGIAITELTSLLSRRTVYCSKYPNSNFSVSKFPDSQGNISYKNYQHTWKNGRCIYCGISNKTNVGMRNENESDVHAYEWIHRSNYEDILKMKFDVIIGNPPYQIKTSGSTESQATPIYNKFIDQARHKIKPKFLCMIVPSRWMSSGFGLDAFRNSMLKDTHIKILHDYLNASDCFPGVSITGGGMLFSLGS
ncbi:MAG: Eco57I restriction-modification methylase domain-containing protein [Succinivibrionaceae bacterium]